MVAGLGVYCLVVCGNKQGIKSGRLRKRECCGVGGCPSSFGLLAFPHSFFAIVVGECEIVCGPSAAAYYGSGPIVTPTGVHDLLRVLPPPAHQHTIHRVCRLSFSRIYTNIKMHGARPLVLASFYTYVYTLHPSPRAPLASCTLVCWHWGPALFFTRLLPSLRIVHA